jgi:hypothetical protein
MRGARRESGRHGTTLTATLFSGGRAALAHRRSRAFRLRDGQLRRIATSSPLACSPMLAPHADGRPGPFGRCGLADRRPVPAVCRRTRTAHGRPNALFCTNFARHIRRRVGQLGVLAGAGASGSPVDLVPMSKARHAGQTGSRLPPRIRARRSGRCAGTAIRPAARRPPLRARCAGAYWRTIAVTMCPGQSGRK